VEEIAGQPVLDKAAAELRFESSGRVSGSTGCNTFTGSATIDAPRLTMSPLATTRRACEPELMDQEKRFLEAIGAVRSFSIDGTGLLHLIGSDGKPLMRLSRAHP
jgi:putative lipoprotein